MTSPEEALAALTAHHTHATATRAQLDRQDVEHVATCRNAGATWQQIAKALGIKQPSAVRKYLPLIEQVRTVRPKTRSEEKP
ncbi:hypothetical protein [Micromonospora sediminicola]|uniref:hypothetical protein n=1 Tax=Micromonospora sediminicola TaxID=946078 RepID=UPI0037B68F9B